VREGATRNEVQPQLEEMWGELGDQHALMVTGEKGRLQYDHAAHPDWMVELREKGHVLTAEEKRALKESNERQIRAEPSAQEAGTGAPSPVPVARRGECWAGQI
jgi:hypothetical protein